MDDSKPAKQQAKHYLTYADGLLRYVPAGSNQPDLVTKPPAGNWENTGWWSDNQDEVNALAADASMRWPGYDYEVRKAPDPYTAGYWIFEIWRRAI